MKNDIKYFRTFVIIDESQSEIPENYVVRVVLAKQYDAALTREDALREELEVANNACSILNDLTKTISTERHALQQRLTVAEQLMQEFCDRVDRGEVRSKTSYAKFKAALKPAAECEHSFHYFGNYPRRRCNNCNALEVVAEGEGS